MNAYIPKADVRSLVFQGWCTSPPLVNHILIYDYEAIPACEQISPFLLIIDNHINKPPVGRWNPAGTQNQTRSRLDFLTPSYMSALHGGLIILARGG